MRGELDRLLEQHAVTVMQATPSRWRMLLESGWEGKSDLRIFAAAKLFPRTSHSSCFPVSRALEHVWADRDYDLVFDRTRHFPRPYLARLAHRQYAISRSR